MQKQNILMNSNKLVLLIQYFAHEGKKRYNGQYQQIKAKMTNSRYRQFFHISTIGAASLMALFLNACETMVSTSTEEADTAIQEKKSTHSINKTSKTSKLGFLEQLERLDGKWLGNTEQSNIWPQMKKKCSLNSHKSHPDIDKFVRRYTLYPTHIQQIAYRATPYLHYIFLEVDKRGMPAEIALLPMIESAFDPFAHSHAGAAGIWQIMPAAGKRFGLKQDWWYDGRRDITASTQAALDYLEHLHTMFDNDWLLALAAYNSGEGTVKRAIEKNIKRNKGTDFFSLDLPQETKNYVPKLLALSKVIQNPEKYEIELPVIENIPYLQTVKVDSQIDLAYAAELANIDLKLLYRLNPGFNRWATHPNGPQDLLLPLAHADKFKSNFAANLSNHKKLTKWQRYQIKSGDTLVDISARYRTSIDAIKHANHLKSNALAVGSFLLIPNMNANTQNPAEQSARLLGKVDSVVHIVKQGDSLWSIAQKYRISVQKITSLNQLVKNATLQPGQRIIIQAT